MQHAGADWLERNGKKLSEHGRAVADILGTVYRGIYHIERHAMRADWSHEWLVKISIDRELATYDRNDLTELVVFCHDACMRLAIRPQMRNILLQFTQRGKREGGSFSERHPTIEQAIEATRAVSTASS